MTTDVLLVDKWCFTQPATPHTPGDYGLEKISEPLADSGQRLLADGCCYNSIMPFRNFFAADWEAECYAADLNRQPTGDVLAGGRCFLEWRERRTDEEPTGVFTNTQVLITAIESLEYQLGRVLKISSLLTGEVRWYIIDSIIPNQRERTVQMTATERGWPT